MRIKYFIQRTTKCLCSNLHTATFSVLSSAETKHLLTIANDNVMLANNNNVWFVLLLITLRHVTETWNSTENKDYTTDTLKYMITISYPMMFFKVTLPAASPQKDLTSVSLVDPQCSSHLLFDWWT